MSNVTNPWDVLLVRDWKGCDLEMNESGQIYRGQIMTIEETAGSLQVVMRWSASMRPDGNWYYDPPARDLSFGYFSFPMQHTIPSDIGLGRVALTTPIGMAVFFPREVSRLDPGRVIGLPPEFAEPDFIDPKD